MTKGPFTLSDVPEQMEAVLIIVEAEKYIHDKQLRDRVRQIEQLGHHEQADQETPMDLAVAAHDIVQVRLGAGGGRDGRANGRATSAGRAKAALRPLRLIADRVEVDRVGQVEQGAPPLVELLHGHVVDGGVGQVEHVHARVLAQSSVHEARQQEEEGEDEQDHGHPLVVLDHGGGEILMGAWKLFF